jgi:glucose-6-phosphate isomerase
VNQGIAVYGNKGSTDQHAYVQQLREGVPNFFATFLEVEKDREDGARSRSSRTSRRATTCTAFLLGTRRALHENGRGSITLTVPDVSARTVGILIALYERAVGLYAQLVGINAYHQPGVEAGKKAAAAVLALQGLILAELRAKPGEFRTAEKVASALGEADVETVFAVLRHLAANPDHGVSRKDGPTFFLATFGVR